MTVPQARTRAAAALAAAIALSGCIAYGPAEVTALSAYDLCEAQLYSRVNLTAAAKSQVGGEIARRNVDCSAQVPAIEADRELELQRAMYENSGP